MKTIYLDGQTVRQSDHMDGRMNGQSDTLKSVQTVRQSKLTHGRTNN